MPAYDVVIEGTSFITIRVDAYDEIEAEIAALKEIESGGYNLEDAEPIEVIPIKASSRKK